MALVLTINGATRGFAPGSLQIAETLNQRATCDFSIRDLAGNAPSVGQSISLAAGGTTIFAGTIDEVRIEKQHDTSALRVLPIRCVDPNQITDRRVAIGYEWVNTRAADIVRAIITNSCGGEGLSLASVAAGTGPLIDRFAITYPTCTEALNALASLAGYRWWIDYAKVVHFENSYSNSPRWTVNNSNKVALAGTVKVRTTREKYANRVVVLLGSYLQTGLTKTFTGDGTTQPFQVDYPIAAVPTVTVAGAAVTVGIADVDTGKVCYWSNGSQFITFTTAPTAGQAIVVTYTGRTIAQKAVQNDTEITARAAVEGGTGVYTALYSIDSDMSDADASSYAASLLDQYDSLSTILEFSTDTIAPATGDLITVSLPAIATGTFLVRSVRTTDLDGTHLRRAVECVSGPVIGDAVDAFKELAGQAVPIAPPATTSGAGSYTAPATPGVPTGLSVTVDDYGQDYGATWGWTPPSPVGSCVSYVRQYKFESWNGSAWVLDSDWGADLVAYPATANRADDGAWPKITGTYRLYGRIASVNADGVLSAWVTSAAQTIPVYGAPPQPPAVTLTLAYESRSGSPYYRNLASLASAGTGSTVAYSWQFRQLNVAAYVDSGSVDIDWFEFQAEYDIAKLTATSDWWPVADAGKFAQVRLVPINADGTDGTPRESAIVAIGASAGLDLAFSKASSLGKGMGKDSLGRPASASTDLQDGDFELGGIGWVMFQLASLETNPANCYSGSKCVRMETTNASYNGAVQLVPCQPGEVFRVRCMGKNGTNAPVRLTVQFRDTAGSDGVEYTQYLAAGGGWTPVELITPPAPTGVAYLRILGIVTEPACTTGQAWMDYVTMERVTPVLASSTALSGLALHPTNTTEPYGVFDFGADANGVSQWYCFAKWTAETAKVDRVKVVFGFAYADGSWVGTSALRELGSAPIGNGAADLAPMGYKAAASNALMYVQIESATGQRTTVATLHFVIPAAPTGTLDLGNAKSTSLNAGEYTITGGKLTAVGVDFRKATNFDSNEFETATGTTFRQKIINATKILTGILQVGGSGMVSRFKIFDTVSNLIGWIGDDTYHVTNNPGGSGYVGAWFKRVLIGGTSPATAKIVADSAGAVSIVDAPLTMTANSVTTTINNNTSTHGVIGLKVALASPARSTTVTEKKIVSLDPSGNALSQIGNVGNDAYGYVTLSKPANGASAGLQPDYLVIYGGSGNKQIELDAVSGEYRLQGGVLIDGAGKWKGASIFSNNAGDPAGAMTDGQHGYWWDGGTSTMWHVYKQGGAKYRVAMTSY